MADLPEDGIPPNQQEPAQQKSAPPQGTHQESHIRESYKLPRPPRVVGGGASATGYTESPPWPRTITGEIKYPNDFLNGPPRDRIKAAEILAARDFNQQSKAARKEGEVQALVIKCAMGPVRAFCQEAVQLGWGADSIDKEFRNLVLRAQIWVGLVDGNGRVYSGAQSRFEQSPEWEECQGIYLSPIASQKHATAEEVSPLPALEPNSAAPAVPAPQPSPPSLETKTDGAPAQPEPGTMASPESVGRENAPPSAESNVISDQSRQGPADRPKGGRPRKNIVIDSEKVKKIRGHCPQAAFGIMCELSEDTIQRAEQGMATEETIGALCRGARKRGHKIEPADLMPQKPQKPQKP